MKRNNAPRTHSGPHGPRAAAALGWALLLAAGLWAGGPVASAQDDAAPTGGSFVERVDVNIVNVEVFVTDRQGNPVTGLTADDFRLFVDREPTAISNFYAEAGGNPADVGRSGESERADRDTGRASELARVVPAETPPEQLLHMTVLVDNTNLRPSHRKRVFRELRDFLSDSLPPEARVSVASLGAGGILRVHSDFLSNRVALSRILDELEESPEQQVGGEVERRSIISELSRGFGSRGLQVGEEAALISRLRAYAAEEYDRGRRALQTLERFLATLGGVPGRRAMLYVADGIPLHPGEEIYVALNQGDNVRNYNVGFSDFRRDIGNFDLVRDFEAVADRANSSGVTMYLLDAAGSATQEIRGAVTEGRLDSTTLSLFEANYRDPQQLVAEATGGRRIEATSRLAKELGEVATELQTFYVLGFEADRSLEPRRQRVRVEVIGRNDLRVRARQAIFTESLEQNQAEAVLATLMYGTGTNALDISLSTGQPELRNDGSAVLPLIVKVPLSQVALLPRGDSHAGELTVYVSTKDETGQPRPVQKLPFHIQVPSDRLDEALQQEGAYTLPLVVRPGDQQVVIGVTDALGTAVSTLRLDLGDLVQLKSPRG